MLKDQNVIYKAQVKAFVRDLILESQEKNQFGGSEHPKQQKILTEEEKPITV